MDFDYKKYSLDKLNEWMHDALSVSEATPQEIYDVIKGVVSENYYIYKNHTERCYELLALLNGNGLGHIQAYDDYVTDPRGNQVKVCDRDDPSPECQKSWNDFWEENYYPEECNTKATKEEREQCKDYNIREAEYYKKQDAYVEEIRKKGGYEWTPITTGSDPYPLYVSEDGDIWCPDSVTKKDDKVVKWQLPVEADPSGEYFVTFPDDLLEIANFKKGDTVEWVDNGDGSYLLRKTTKPLRMDEC